jgi:hypothetical protein
MELAEPLQSVLEVVPTLIPEQFAFSDPFDDEYEVKCPGTTYE